MVQYKDMQFLRWILKWKETRQNLFDLPEQGFEPHIMFDPLIWISQKFDGDGSKSKNVTKTDRSLSNYAL